MKKILVLIGAILISAGSTFASQCNFECPGNPYAFSYSISNFTGTNFLAERIANMLIKKQILKESQGKYKGRPTRITDKFIYCTKAWSEGKIQLKEAIAESGVSEPTFFRQCKKLGIKKIEKYK